MEGWTWSCEQGSLSSEELGDHGLESSSVEKVGCDQDLRDHMSPGSAPAPMSRQHCPEIEEQTQVDGWPDTAPKAGRFQGCSFTFLFLEGAVPKECIILAKVMRQILIFVSWGICASLGQ